jgi:hypothetical protein
MSVRASHRARSARATLANARSSLVGRPNARLRRTRRRGFVATRASARSSSASSTRSAANHVKRHRAAEASIRPTSASRPHVSRPALSRAAGRCTVRRQHRSHRHERRAPPPQSVRRPHGGRSASRPRTTSIGAFIVDGRNRAVADAAPHNCCASANRSSRRRCAAKRGQGEQASPALATPRAAG